jgi:hypothetical protein
MEEVSASINGLSTFFTRSVSIPSRTPTLELDAADA